MFHSVTINGKNSWDDYHMVPVDGIYLPPPPEQKITTIDLKTGDGVVDVSTILTGYPVFNNRSGSLKYYLLEPSDIAQYAEVGGSQNINDMPSAYDVYSQIMADIHGQSGEMFFEDDPNWVYKGRFSVNAFEFAVRRAITINYNVQPYKIARTAYTSRQFVGLGESSWDYIDLTPAQLGYMPVNPKVTITGNFSPGDSVKVQIMYPPYGGSSPKTITKTLTTTYTNQQWPEFIAYKNARFAFQASSDSGKNFKAVFSFNQGRF